VSLAEGRPALDVAAPAGRHQVVRLPRTSARPLRIYPPDLVRRDVTSAGGGAHALQVGDDVSVGQRRKRPVKAV